MISVFLATLLLEADGVAVMPLVIVAVVVAYVVTASLAPTSVSAPNTAAGTANTASYNGRPATTPPARTQETDP